MKLFVGQAVAKPVAREVDRLIFQFPKRVRLLRAREFQRVFAARASASQLGLAMYGAESDLQFPRLGLTVSRRIGGATVRNRWKRLLREAFRLTQHRLPPLDLVCVVRAPAPPEIGQLIEALPIMASKIERRLARDIRRSEKDAQ